MKLSLVHHFQKENIPQIFFFEKKEGVTRILFGNKREIPEEYVLNKNVAFIPKTSEKEIAVLLKGRGLDFFEQLRLSGFELLSFAKNYRLNKIYIDFQNAKEQEFQALVEGLLLATYSFDRYKSEPEEKFVVEVFIKTSETWNAESIKNIAETEFKYVSLAKDLINTTGSDLTPQIFVDKVQEIAEPLGIQILIRNKTDLEKENFNGLLTVGKGSSFEPYMVTLSYSPKTSSEKHLALVGKGITFDTGGLSLKPAARMAEMVSDMAGAASVFASICAIAELQIPLKVTAVLCLAENRIGSGAVLPGDIFKAKNGKTVLVDNTDAEGRLILTDGLFEASRVFATHVIDMATLTGAMVRALGTSVAGYFANEDSFADLIFNAGKSVGEKFWRMPLEQEYAYSLKGTFSDLKNTGLAEGGSICAALFLSEFVKKNTAWSHLDIAGTAFTTKKWKYTTYGATGFGIKTLIQVAKDLA